MGIGAIISGASSILGASAASDAADAQEAAAREQLALQERTYDETVERFQPFYGNGLDYNSALRYELLGGERPTFGGSSGGNALSIEEVAGTPARNGLPPELFGKEGDRAQTMQARLDAQNFLGINPNSEATPASYKVGEQSFSTRDAAQAYIDSQNTGGTPYGGYEATDYNKYLMSEGIRAIDSSAASRGGLFSGATQKAQQDRAVNLASSGYDNYLNRLTGQAAQGQAAAGNMANAGANYAQGASNAYANIGNAQSAGAIGVNNALQGGISNGIGLWNYQNQQNNTGGASNANIFSAPWGSSGFWG